jgi:hypothetical protein
MTAINREQGREPIAESIRVLETIAHLREVDEALAAKLLPAAQLALFQESAAPAASVAHTWRYVGQQNAGTLYECTRCPVTMRNSRRFQNSLTTYSLDGKRFSKIQPVCTSPRVRKVS